MVEIVRRGENFRGQEIVVVSGERTWEVERAGLPESLQMNLLYVNGSLACYGPADLPDLLAYGRQRIRDNGKHSPHCLIPSNVLTG